jgi:hypothetical protein
MKAIKKGSNHSISMILMEILWFAPFFFLEVALDSEVQVTDHAP